MPHQMANPQFEECARICHECYDECLRTSVHCLGLGGNHATVEHQTLLNDCAQVCHAAGNLLHRGSHFAERQCAVCAEICRACGDDCAQIAGGDATMQGCAETCRRCAEACERMAGAAV